MIYNELHDGQGLGNQLWNYALARIISDRNQCGFSILSRQNFKGKQFMDIDFGSEPEEGEKFYYKEKSEYLAGTDTDISRTDPTLLEIKPFTKFDGNCQSTKYLVGYQDKLRQWIKIKPDYAQYATDENVCVIHFRSGDYKKIKDVFLPAEYYQNAMEYVRSLNKDVIFCCVTDEKAVAEKMLPGVKVIGSAILDEKDQNMASHHRGGPIGIDFSLLMNAYYLIIPNSSFSWWASYLNANKKTVVAPKYWARHNVSDGYWSTSDIITDDFTYMGRDGIAKSAMECSAEKNAYEMSHPNMFSAEATKPGFLSRLFSRVL